MHLDFTSDHGKQAKQQLESEIVIWLTTVTPNGMPQPNPVWFVWQDDCVITWVQPNSARMRNFESNKQVSLHFNTDPGGHHITVLTGEAEIDLSLGTILDNDEYSRKYGDSWGHIDMTPESASKEFSVPLRIRPTRLRGF